VSTIEHSIPPTSIIVTASKNAGFWLRLIAAALDFMIVAIPLLMINGFFHYEILGISWNWSGGVQHVFPAPAGIVMLEACGFWLYAALMESSAMQATVGKQAVGLRVINEEGQRLSFMEASARHFAKVLSTALLGIGFFMIGWTAKKQGLHDKLASTFVVKRSKR
jgi:uncharacterized RDD family membrane protein YckC